jgi:filamentous hemagglutinin family protein
MNYDKVLLIISDKYKEIGEKIMHDLKRGGTLLGGTGMYQQQEKQIIFTVVNRREAIILQSYINNIDPRAFVTIINSNEILGEGFKSLQEKLDQ